MASEVKDFKPVAFKSDMYSLGLFLYYMMIKSQLF